MSEKIFNTRIIHKHDIEANWNKAVNFIPKQGELIIYDIDDNYNYQRIKIGDGIRTIINLPFIGNVDEEFFAQSVEPIEAVNGDFWVDTSESTYAQKKIHESPTEPIDSQDGDLWIDTSDMV